MGTLQSCVLQMETGVTGGGIDGGRGSTLCRSYCCPWAKQHLSYREQYPLLVKCQQRLVLQFFYSLLMDKTLQALNFNATPEPTSLGLVEKRREKGKDEEKEQVPFFMGYLQIINIILATCQTTSGGPTPASSARTAGSAGGAPATSDSSANTTSFSAGSALEISDSPWDSRRTDDLDFPIIPALPSPLAPEYFAELLPDVLLKEDKMLRLPVALSNSQKLLYSYKCISLYLILRNILSKIQKVVSMSQTVDTLQNQISQSQFSQAKPQPSFQYQMVDMKARKISTLIKISKLPYILQEVTEIQQQKCVLKTVQGDLTNQYEIIGYIINDHFMRNLKSIDASQLSEDRPAFQLDIFSLSKINEKLFELRKTLFPLLDEFYRYVQGHELVKKIKYQNLQNKIRKEIHKLDQQVGQHSQIYGADFSYINIIIACELFFCYRLVFEQKFRKSKARLFSLCEKIYNTTQFEDIYGKKRPCMKEYQPVEFQPEEEAETKKEEAIQIELTKIAEPWISVSCNQSRNQLLYNFFRGIFKGQESKMNYFAYFWMMFDNLVCNLVEISYENGEGAQDISELEKAVELGVQDLSKIVKTQVDYGFLGLYFNQKQRQYRLQGLICLAELSFEDLCAQMSRQPSLKNFKPSKLDVASEQQRSKVEILWEHQTMGETFEGIKVSLLRQL